MSLSDDNEFPENVDAIDHLRVRLKFFSIRIV